MSGKQQLRRRVWDDSEGLAGSPDEAEPPAAAGSCSVSASAFHFAADLARQKEKPKLGVTLFGRPISSDRRNEDME
jgi:hypothetical protein